MYGCLLRPHECGLCTHHINFSCTWISFAWLQHLELYISSKRTPSGRNVWLRACELHAFKTPSDQLLLLLANNNLWVILSLGSTKPSHYHVVQITRFHSLLIASLLKMASYIVNFVILECNY